MTQHAKRTVVYKVRSDERDALSDIEEKLIADRVSCLLPREPSRHWNAWANGSGLLGSDSNRAGGQRTGSAHV